MIWLIATNQPCCIFGLKRARVTSRTRFAVLALASSSPKRLSFLRDDFLNVRWTSARLAHRGRVGDDLDRRRSALGQVVLKLGRNIDDKGVFALVHRAIDLAERYDRGGQKQRRQERIADLAGDCRMIFIDHRDRSIYHVHHGAFRGRVHGKREGVKDQKQQHRVAEQAEQLFDSELKDVPEVLHRLVFLLLQQCDRRDEIDKSEQPKRGDIAPQCRQTRAPW